MYFKVRKRQVCVFTHMIFSIVLETLDNAIKTIKRNKRYTD